MPSARRSTRRLAVPPTPEIQLAWFSAALEELTAFLLSPDIFRPLHHPPPRMAQDLSLGSLLLAFDVLHASRPALAPADQARWDHLRLRWEAERAAQPAVIEAKASAEVPRRLSLWRAYMQELGERPAEADEYASEVRHRVIIDRLQGALGGRSQGTPIALIDRLDRALRPWLEQAPFLWGQNLRAAYPEARFWYLYGHPERGRILANPAEL